MNCFSPVAGLTLQAASVNVVADISMAAYFQTSFFGVQSDMMRMVIIFLFLLFVPVSNAAAQGAPLTGDFASLKHTGSARIDKVIDAQTILLNDGKIVRLLSLQYPFVTDEETGGSTLAAKAFLEKALPNGTEVMLYQTRNQKTGRINRMGHTLAHLVIKKDGNWINGLLVAGGFAYAMTDADNPEMADQLYALEQMARQARRGLWQDGSPFGLLSDDMAAQGNGQFRVVEGTVNRAASSKNNIYLNFGADWRKDFTAQVSPALRKELSKRDIDPLSLTGQKVRVRGWIREWNGPFMELETADRLEILPAESP